MLYDLTLHATRPEFAYSHEWQVGDLVIWDNRCTMHRGCPHDDARPRDLRRATTLEAGSTLDEAAEPNLNGWPALKAAAERRAPACRVAEP